MSNNLKNQQKILRKLGIQQLKPMQEAAISAIETADEIVLLSPTGSGKTLAFLLPLIAQLDPKNPEIQVLILVPSRELAIQIEQVAREMGSGFKINTVYGGRPISKDFMDLSHPPAILIGTPGRVADHLRRETFKDTEIKTLVLDEFDKSLEIGFDEEMSEIIGYLPNIEKKILTSATAAKFMPDFVGLRNPKRINYLNEAESALQVQAVASPDKDKLQTLVNLLGYIGNKPGIVFCNFKETIQRVSDFLEENNISHGVFHGSLEQKEREQTLIKFRNGTHQIILATDLAARGLDIPEIAFIIHYHLPSKVEEFTHRNGRTARMGSGGTAYIIHWEAEKLPNFITESYPNSNKSLKIEQQNPLKLSEWATLFVSGGRRDKISKGDIAGFMIKKGGLKKDELGIIELKQDCAFVAIHKSKIKPLIQQINNTYLKKRKVRVYQI